MNVSWQILVGLTPVEVRRIDGRFLKEKPPI
jgi:hypothetical protein